MSEYSELSEARLHSAILDDESNLLYHQRGVDSTKKRLAEIRAELEQREPFKKELSREYGVFVSNSVEEAKRKRLLVGIFECQGYASSWADQSGMYQGRWVIRQRVNGLWGPVIQESQVK